MARTLTALGILAPGNNADARCECVSGPAGCGRDHQKTGDNRCHATDNPAHPLVLVAPGRTVVAAAELARDELVAWCPACCTHAAQAAQRAADNADQHDGPDLLDLLAQEVPA